MIAAPLLSEAEVRLEVERLFRRDHRSKLLALFGGRGQPGRFELDGLVGDHPHHVRARASRTLPLPGEPATPGRVYLVDWAEDALPLDVSCRLAGGRVYHVARDARLAALFGARQVEPGLAGSAVARLFLTGALPGPRKVTGLRLERNALMLRFLEAKFEFPEHALESGVALLRWTRERDVGPAFVRACETDEALHGARRELLDWISRRLGALGSLAWRAFEAGLSERVLQVGVLAQAARAQEDAYVRGLVGGQIAAWLPGLAPEFRACEASFSDPGGGDELLEVLLGAEVDARVQRLLEGTQKLANESGLQQLSKTSPWLPDGHALREQAFSSAIDAFVAAPSSEALGQVLTSLEALKQHRLDGVLRRSEHDDARQMTARLAAWLWKRKVRPQDSSYGAVWQPVADLARRYTEEGGHLGWARQLVRAMRGGEALETSARKLLAAVDIALREDNRRFAEAYVSWLDAGKPSNEVIPIEHVARRIVAPFLAKSPHRKLLVVLMDGMSHASAVQLLSRLREQRRWRPIQWRAEGWSGSLPLPPVLAVAPTLTAVSRAAFFAGEADPRFGDQGTDRDEQRWAGNRIVRELSGGEPVRLFFRQELKSGHELLEEMKRAIAGDQRVVAVVVNAIDEQLKGSFQVGVDYSHTPIHPLDALLGAAEGAERAVLLVADHGHVTGDALRPVSGRTGNGRPGGARWRALRDGEQPEADEVVLPATTWRPSGFARVAVPWDPSISYESPHHGEHGGLSLAEAVAPAILIAPEWLERVAGDDLALSVVDFPEPDWWRLEVAKAPAPVVVQQAPEPTQQLTLLTVAAPAPAAPGQQVAPALAEPSLVKALRGSRVFKDQVRGTPDAELERVLGWLTALLRAGDVLPSADFARVCGVRAHQVGGVVARMGILNADGFAVVEHDVAGRRVVLHRSRLIQQYGVKE